jgi:hypothetical protein
LKHIQQVNHVLNHGKLPAGQSVSLSGGIVSLSENIVDNSSKLELELKVTIFGSLQAFSDNIDLSDLPRTIQVNRGFSQLGFKGTIIVA